MTRTSIEKPNPPWAYEQLWRIVDGAVQDAFRTHPDYLTRKGKFAARRSIVKRVTGSVLGYATQVAQGRSGEEPAADVADPAPTGQLHPRAALVNGLGGSGADTPRGWLAGCANRLASRLFVRRPA